MTTMGWARGDDVNIVFSFPDVDIAGYDVLFTVKVRTDDDPLDEAAVIAVAATVDADEGTATVTLSGEESAIPARPYVWDLKLIAPSGEATHTEVGELVVRRGVTNRG